MHSSRSSNIAEPPYRCAGRDVRDCVQGTSDSPQRRQECAVVGGGLLGMTVAWKLARRGHRVTLYEAGDHLGGLADAWQLGDVTWDRHYHVILLSDQHTRQMLAELDLEDECRWVETRTGFYTDGQLHSMSNTLEFLRFPPLRMIDKLRLGATIFYASKLSNWRQLEEIPVVDWLTRCSGRRTVEKIWLPLLRAKLGDNYQQTSAAFIWATIARMYAARRSGLKKEMFGYVTGGYAKILSRLTQALTDAGVTIKTGCPAQAIAGTSDGRVRVEGTGFSCVSDTVVVTLPTHVASSVCPSLSDAEHTQLRNVQYQGIVCASLLLKQPLAGYYVTNITEAWVPFTAVIEMSALVDREQFGGHSLIYLPKYVASDSPLLNASDSDIREQFVGSLLRMYPHLCAEDIVQFRLSRARHVMPIPTLGYSASVPEMTTSIPGLYLVNSSQIVNGTLNVNETINLANRALDQQLCPIA